MSVRANVAAVALERRLQKPKRGPDLGSFLDPEI